MSEWSKRTYEAALKIFSDEGFSVGGFNVKLNSKTTVEIEKNEDQIKILFSQNRPTISFKKIIKIKVLVNGIVFEEDGGLFMLDFFPDIPFKYDWIEDE